MDTVDVIIIVAVVVGTLALCLVVFILYWAWNYDRRNRETYRNSKPEDKGEEKPPVESSEIGGEGNQDNSISTFDPPPETEKIVIATGDGPMMMAYPTEVGGDDGNYPDSIISEGDINSGIYYTKDSERHSSSVLEGGSVSSIDAESYGYSIEAPSMATGTINSGHTPGVAAAGETEDV